MKTFFVSVALSCSTLAFAAPNPAELKFTPEVIGLPPLSLSESIDQGTLAPQPPQFDAKTPLVPRARRPAPRAPRKPTSSMPVVEPDPSIDYKLHVVPPDPNVDFKLRIAPADDPSQPRR